MNFDNTIANITTNHNEFNGTDLLLLAMTAIKFIDMKNGTVTTLPENVQIELVKHLAHRLNKCIQYSDEDMSDDECLEVFIDEVPEILEEQIQFAIRDAN